MRVVIIGAGGHGAVVADILLRMRDAGFPIEPIAFVDDGLMGPCPAVLSIPVVAGGLPALHEIDYDAAIVAIGDNAARRRVSEALRASGIRLAIARHPSCVVAPDVQLQPGTMICAGAAINCESRVGPGTIVNTHATIDHHNIIGAYVHIGPGAHLGGNVTVGAETLIGIGSTVMPRRRIGQRVVVGAGAVLTGDLPDAVTAVGVPARIVESHQVHGAPTLIERIS